MRTHPPHISLALAALLLISAAGCQSSVRMTRPDADATLSRPDDWLRERNRESADTLFQMRHPIEPVRVRLRRLERPIASHAHEPWALLWIDAALDEATVESASTSTMARAQAVEVRSQFTNGATSLTHELRLANADGATYLLETWGTPQAMKRTAEARRTIVQSLVLPRGEALSEGVAAVEVNAAQWRVLLPAIQATDLTAEWTVDRSNDAKLVFSLPSHLIEGEVLSEELDYPIDAQEYAQIARGAEADFDASDLHSVTLRVVGNLDARVQMHTTYRFLTRDEQAVQIAVSTPQAVYEKNQGVIDALVESLEIVSHDENAGPRDETAEK